MNDQDVKRLYQSRQWRDRTQPVVIARNPICQYFDPIDGQCQKPSEIVHHLRDPKDAPALFYTWSNLVAVCAGHHQGGQRGETQGYLYVHTIGLMGTVYEHNGGWPCWRSEFNNSPLSKRHKELLREYAAQGAFRC